MGRPRKTNPDLPSRVYLKNGAYYYVDYQSKWHRLAPGGDKTALYKALSHLLGGEQSSGMAAMFDRYEVEVLPTKAVKTQKDQKAQLKTLRKVFGNMHPKQILPVHIAKYLDRRSAKSMANREIALLSHVFRKIIRWGEAVSNPCSDVERNKETPRTRYVTDAEFGAVYALAPPLLRVLMDLAYLTGQRQADLLKIRVEDLRDDGIYFRQNKTGVQIVVVWSDDLRAVVAQAQALQTDAETIRYVVAAKNGQLYKSETLRTAWQRLMAGCVEKGVIKERFTFHDLRAKARSDGDDKRLLGHANPEAMARVYQRKPVLVRPVKRKEY